MTVPKFAANLTMLFGELPFVDRFAAAKAAGFAGVEYLFPYDFDKAELSEQLQQHGLTQVLHNLPAGNWAAGERGIAILPDRVDEFRDGVARAIDYAKALDCPGFFLSGTEQAVQLIADVRSSNLFVQYDIYHMQVMEGDIARSLQKHLSQIAHVQLADNPGRNEPGTGEINYPFLFRHLDEIGYRGWVGCEYKPKTRTIDGLGWHASLTLDT